LTVTHGEDLIGTTTQTVDSNGDSARARETLYGTGARLEKRLVDGTLYVRANVPGLEFLLYLYTKHARRYAGKWIAITPKDKEVYTAMLAAMTPGSFLPSASSDGAGIESDPRVYVDAGSQLKLSRRTSHGMPVLDLKARGPSGFSDWEFTARASGEPLPVSFYFGCGMVCEYRGVFSKWNEPVHVEAPAHAVPFETVRRG
jgi:hypothetical protein